MSKVSTGTIFEDEVHLIADSIVDNFPAKSFHVFGADSTNFRRVVFDLRFAPVTSRRKV
jgi:hypothetical protein